MVVKVKLEEIFGGEVVKCLICNGLGKSKHLGLELVAPRVMFDEQQTRFVICKECLRKEKETIRLDLLQKAEELEAEAHDMRLLAAQEIDLPSYEEWKREERLADEKYVKAALLCRGLGLAT